MKERSKFNKVSLDKYVFSMQRTLPKSNPIARALCSFRAQKARCTNKGQIDYKHYGGKGVCVSYGKDDFVNWWLKEMLKYPKGTKLTVDRVDTAGNYCFDNIQLIPWKENVRKSNYERAQLVDVYDIKTGLFVKTCRGAAEAGRFGGMGCSNVLLHMNVKTTTARLKRIKFTYRKHGDTF